MNNRTKRLYIVVPLLWIVIVGAATWTAYVRSPKGPVVEEEKQEKEAPQSLAPGGEERVASGIEMPAWGMSVPPARGRGEARLVGDAVERRVTPLGSEREGWGAFQRFHPWL
ncbi:MAG: hypothetical protein ABFE07_11750 [Armatimonadia bacterium]